VKERAEAIKRESGERSNQGHHKAPHPGGALSAFTRAADRPEGKEARPAFTEASGPYFGLTGGRVTNQQCVVTADDEVLVVHRQQIANSERQARRLARR
jgi:hypothetical protein